MEIANNLINNNSQLMESQKMPDQTIEILMTDLDLDVMSIFSKAESMNNKDATEVSLFVAYRNIQNWWLFF